MSNLEFIFLTFDRLELTKQSLSALLNSDPDIDYKVYIWDNGSTDGTVEYLKTLSHPKIGGITFSPTNRGIAPVTNQFWSTTKATFIGKVDNDLIVPKGWIKEVLKRVENAPKDRIGSVTLYHWIDDWADEIDLAKCKVIECSNKSRLLVSPHTGGNYIFHRYLFDILGKTVNEKQGLKGGYTDWLWQGGSKLKHGYIYPLQFFRIPELYRIWENYKHKGIVDENSKWLEREKVSARKLLEWK